MHVLRPSQLPAMALVAVPEWRAHRSAPHMSAASHEWYIFWGARSGSQHFCPMQVTLKADKVQPRTFYVARKIWDRAQDNFRKELCMKLIAGVVSQWLVCKACGRYKKKSCAAPPDATAGWT